MSLVTKELFVLTVVALCIVLCSVQVSIQHLHPTAGGGGGRRWPLADTVVSERKHVLWERPRRKALEWKWTRVVTWSSGTNPLLSKILFPSLTLHRDQ